MSSVSVIIPVFNVEKYLKRCVNSVLNQTYTDFDLVLVDDGSPDNSGKLCDCFSEKYSNVYVIHKKNGGLSDARNAGLDFVFEKLKSKYVTFIDSDDWVDEKYIEALIKAMQMSGNNTVAVCGYQITDGFKWDAIDGYDTVIESTEDFYINRRVNATIAWGKLFKMDDFNLIRFPIGKLHEDEFTTYRLLFKYKNCSFVKQPMYFYFENPSGITKSKWNIKRLDGLKAYEEQLLFFEENEHDKAYLSSVYAAVTSILGYLKNIRLYYPDEKEIITDLKKQLIFYVDEYNKYSALDEKIMEMVKKTIHPNLYKIEKKLNRKFRHFKEFVSGM